MTWMGGSGTISLSINVRNYLLINSIVKNTVKMYLNTQEKIFKYIIFNTSRKVFKYLLLKICIYLIPTCSWATTNNYKQYSKIVQHTKKVDTL